MEISGPLAPILEFFFYGSFEAPVSDRLMPHARAPAGGAPEAPRPPFSKNGFMEESKHR